MRRLSPIAPTTTSPVLSPMRTSRVTAAPVSSTIGFCRARARPSAPSAARLAGASRASGGPARGGEGRAGRQLGCTGRAGGGEPSAARDAEARGGGIVLLGAGTVHALGRGGRATPDGRVERALSPVKRWYDARARRPP